MYKCIDNILSKTFVRNLQLTNRIEFLSDLNLTQIASKEIHHSTELMEQVTLNFHIMHFITELCTTNKITDIADTFCSHNR